MTRRRRRPVRPFPPARPARHHTQRGEGAAFVPPPSSFSHPPPSRVLRLSLSRTYTRRKNTQTAAGKAAASPAARSATAAIRKTRQSVATNKQWKARQPRSNGHTRKSHPSQKTAPPPLSHPQSDGHPHRPSAPPLQSVRPRSVFRPHSFSLRKRPLPFAPITGCFPRVAAASGGHCGGGGEGAAGRCPTLL